MMWLLSLISLILLEGNGGDAGGVVTSCPENFQDGQLNIINCTVNQTSILGAQCLSYPLSVDFQFISASGTPKVLCSSPHPGTSCAPQTIPGGCICESQSSDLFFYQFFFVGNQTSKGGNFSCSICDISANPSLLPRDTSPHCHNIQFENPTTTAAIIGSTSTSQPVTVDGEPDCKWWCILLIIIGIILLIIIIIIIIIIVVRRKRHRKWAIAIEDWNGCTEILEFKEGDVITVLEHEGSFWKGEIRGQAGSFPKDFVTVMKDSGSGDMKVQASQGWKQNDKLTFRGGDRILIIQQKETIWKGELKNQIGWFPCEKVKLEKCCGCCGCCVRTQGDSQGIPLNSVHNSPTA